MPPVTSKIHENSLLMPVQYLKGVGPHLAKLFEVKSIYTSLDLLFFLPVKYVDRRLIHTVKTLPIDKKQTLMAEIVSLDFVFLKKNRRKILNITVKDNTGEAQLVFFQFHEKTMRQRFPVGKTALFFGDVTVYRGLKQMAHPEVEIFDEIDLPETKIYPLYSLTEGLYQKTIRRIFNENLNDLLSKLQDDPRSVRESGDVVISLKEAFSFIHQPPADADLESLNLKKSAHHQRIIYDEFFYLQLGLISKRYKLVTKKSFVTSHKKELFSKAVKHLPFELTSHQQNALAQIEKDFSTGKPMNRLLQGDVGSGKTIVAFLSSLLVIGSGYQVAMMAPTEILAEQHFKNLLPYENLLGIRIDLLTSSTPAKKRLEMLGHLMTGRIDLLIGTHALITSDVDFYNLGYVIVDEQHRFGVNQRAQLRKKSQSTDSAFNPHVLFMTATPIPRTLSMCLYGDLDVSIIRELPKGRKSIITQIIREKQRQKTYDFILNQLQQGFQAYFVYPLIAESEKLDLKNATEMYEKLIQVFNQFQVGLLHGKMKSAEKEFIMQKFKAKEIHVLVSTTVIEVGVDVPNATIMVVEHAERFGLSQLHQLRGRVGRGGNQSYCFLLAQYAQSEESRFRLHVMEQTHDGFVIAEEDLKLRGPGEFLGTKQSGMPDFYLAQVVRDESLLIRAKERAEDVLAEDPDLIMEKNQLMKKIMLERWGQRLDLTFV